MTSNAYEVAYQEALHNSRPLLR